MDWIRRISSNASEAIWRTYNRYCVRNCKMTHTKCRNSTYPRSTVERQNVPDDKVSWFVPFPEYFPPNYTDKNIKGKEWADVDYETEGDPNTVIWNAVDPILKVDRMSFMGKYKFLDNGLPMNPVGRTGLSGRGVLGRWGPNHAGDPIVTRWKRDENNKIVIQPSGKPVLQFVSIQRKDNKEWAIPGGMVDPGEKISETLKREFAEEAMNLLESSGDERNASIKKLDEAFHHGVEIYKGYVDDPRNTDNAWMETVAHNFHDEDGAIFTMKFHSGDDAIGVRWMDMDGNLELYASHKSFIEKVVRMRGAHW